MKLVLSVLMIPMIGLGAAGAACSGDDNQSSGQTADSGAIAGTADTVGSGGAVSTGSGGASGAGAKGGAGGTGGENGTGGKGGAGGMDGTGGKGGSGEVGGSGGMGGVGGMGGSGGMGGTGGGGHSGKAITDDFERATLGSNWEVAYPTGADGAQVRILANSDLGMAKGNQAFFLVDWVGDTFSADQYCEATISPDAPAGWAYMVYVRRQPSNGARYGFAYDSDISQPYYGDWIFKYDGVPGPQTRVFASIKATTAPKPGDRLRVEIVGYTLKGYLTGALVLQATDTDATKIANGRPGLASRLSTGNGTLGVDSKVWESFAAGDM